MLRFTQILKDQREEINRQGKIIERDCSAYFQSFLRSNLVKVITGVRRCGKSTLAFQLLKDKNFGYINFDDEELTEIAPEKLNDLLKSAYEVYGKIDYLILDEVQNVNKWELFVNRLQRQGLNIIVTGSNAKLLSKELATHLTGRHLAIELFPFSFREFLKYQGLQAKPETTLEIGLTKKYFQEYCQQGGFPEVLKKETEFKTYLKGLYSTIIIKDILVKNRIKHQKTFKDLSIYLISNFGREVSFNRLKNIFHLGSEHTSKNYLGFLEESCLVFLVDRFSYKKKESLIGNKKIYAIDTGLINTLSSRFSEDIGHIYENIVALELLRKKTLDSNLEIYYWKNQIQEEVDFVVKENLAVKELIQVCYDLQNELTKKRETRSLVKAMNEFKLKEGLVITEDYDSEEMINGKKIKFMPLWRWLLEK